MSDDAYGVTHSPLERKVTRDDITVEIFIYRGEGDEGWILEVEDHKGMRFIDEDGIGSLAEAVGINTPT